MSNAVYIYRSMQFDGNIYVKIECDEEIGSAHLTLSRDGKPFTTTSIRSKECVFRNMAEGSYQVEAKITLQDQQLVTSSSQAITIDSAIIKSSAANTIQIPADEQQRVYLNVKNHFLEVQVDGQNLDQLREDIGLLLSGICAVEAFTLTLSEESVGVSNVASRSETCIVNAAFPLDDIVRISQELEKLAYVRYCIVVPDTTDMLPPPPPVLPPFLREEQAQAETSSALAETAGGWSSTPDFTGLQTYLNAGLGMNVKSAWDRGITGRGATVRHLDFGVYRNHEDLKGNITVINSRPQHWDCDHGTASVGCISAIKNNSGVTGIAHGCHLYFYEIDDINLILRDVSAGDIVSLDIQLSVRRGLVPVIDSRHWWQKINAIVNKGAVVILAAGNGGLDLSRSSGALNDYGDSGSILVGACHHSSGTRVGFSNYNHTTSLINSWGDWSVASTGYGDLQNLGDERSYTKNYAGTSSATPLCAGALALIQSYAIQYRGIYLNSRQMRDLIIRTGYREGTGSGIGYRPNVDAAIASL